MKFSLPVKLLLGFLAAWTASAAENTADYNSHIWQSDEGLPLDNAQAITQTASGYLWIGTQEGLARFDGAQFKIYDPKNVPEMKSGNIKGLCEGLDGSLWIATDPGGLIRLKEGKFHHYGVGQGLADNGCLGAVFADASGFIWVATREGLCQFNGKTFTTLTSAGGLSSSDVRSICQDRAGRLWFATAKGVDCWKDGIFISHFSKTNGLSSDDSRAVYCDRRGTIWIGANDELFRMKSGKPEIYVKKRSRNSDFIIKLFEDRRGNLWAGTYNNGLNRVMEGKFIPELSNGRQPYGKINDIFEDRENNLWLCIRDDGLVRLKANRIQCYSQEQGLANNNVMSVLERRDGTMCVGTWGGSLNLIKDGVVSVYSSPLALTNANPPSSTNQAAFPMFVLALFEDRADRLWLGTDYKGGDYKGGLFELDKDDLRHFTAGDGTPFPSIRVVCEDHEKNLWVGTSVGLYFRWGNKLDLYRADARLQNGDIRAMHEDTEGNLWVGTLEGVAKMHDHSITWYTVANGLSSDAIAGIFEDQKHDIWLGTAGGGLNRFHLGKFTSYTTHQGLFSDNIYEILEDEAHWLWMSSERGIFRVRRNSLDNMDEGKATAIHCVSYGKTDGMLNNICTAVSKPAACKSSDGRLWFATIKGLCVIDPKKEDILPEYAAPPVVIEELMADRQPIPGVENSHTPVSLPPGRGELEFRYAALSFFETENNRFKYKLEGVDSDWMEAGSGQIAHYNNIYPGHYVFHVIACNGDGVWNEQGATLGVVILPHFWQHLWFRPAVAVLIAGLMFLGWRIRIARREEIERLRLHIAADLHDEIGSNLASISLLSQLSPKSPDEGERSELSEINRIALATAQSIREIVWFINPDYDTLPEMNLRMKDVAAQMLIGVKYTFEATAVPARGKLPLELRRNIFLVFKEILHNVAKHSGATQVEITLREARGKLVLRVADDGRGFDLTGGRRGNGLKNMRLRAAKMGGTVDLASAPGQGTIITVTVGIP